MTMLEWLSGGGLVTLIGLSLFLWLRSLVDERFRVEIRQALLGYEGQGGMMQDLKEVREACATIRERLNDMDRELRDEITRSRHDLRNEFAGKLANAEERLGSQIDALEGRVRDLERGAA